MNNVTRFAALATLTGLAVMPATAAFAAQGAGHHHVRPVKAAAHGHGRPAVRHFYAAGVVTATSGSASDATGETVTITRHEGRKVVSWTVGVTAKTLVRKGDKPASAADVAKGSHVAAKGDVVAGVLTASRMNIAPALSESTG